jgi:ABC-type transporter Mla maintaining outer membrane lipid asymmetry ATPase subunit MlaF
MTPVVQVEHLTKRFGRQTIWEDVSLTLPAGEISVLLGPSGTPFTCTVRMPPLTSTLQRSVAPVTSSAIAPRNTGAR